MIIRIEKLIFWKVFFMFYNDRDFKLILIKEKIDINNINKVKFWNSCVRCFNYIWEVFNLLYNLYVLLLLCKIEF